MTTQLNDKLIAVEVPQDAKDFKILGNNIAVHWESESEGKGQYFLPMGEFKVLGLVTSKGVQFDCEDLVNSFSYATAEYGKPENNYSKYWNYLTGVPDKDSAADSFRSLLQSKSLDASKYYLIIEKI